MSRNLPRALINLLARLLRLPWSRKPPATPLPAAPEATPLPAVPEATPLPAAPEATHPRRTRTRSSATQVARHPETFAQLLDHIDDLDAALVLPSVKRNWLSKRDVALLRKVGTYIPHPWLMEWVPDPVRLPDGISTAVAMVASGVPARKNDPDMIAPRLIWAIKHASLPPGVEQIPGRPYRFGWSVELQGEEKYDPTAPKKQFDLWAWVVVGPDRTIYVPRQEHISMHYVRARRASGHGETRSRLIVIPQRHMVTQLLISDLSGGRTIEKNRHFVALAFRQLAIWWAERDTRWNVICRHGERRITFGVRPDQTASYFAERRLTQAGESGRRKPIIHLVREHQRIGGETVREHLRGESRFAWRGWNVNVVAPGKTGVVATTCPVDPVELGVGERRPAGHVSIHAAIRFLVEAEDVNKKDAEESAA